MLPMYYSLKRNIFFLYSHVQILNIFLWTFQRGKSHWLYSSSNEILLVGADNLKIFSELSAAVDNLKKCNLKKFKSCNLSINYKYSYSERKYKNIFSKLSSALWKNRFWNFPGAEDNLKNIINLYYNVLSGADLFQFFL